MSEGTATIVISGNLARDPETKQLSSGPVLEFTVACNSRQKVGGQYGDVPAWYRCSLFGKRGESLGRLLHKGDMVIVSGRLVPREYKGKDGTTKTSLDVKAYDVTLGGRSNGARSGAQHTSGPASDYFPDPDGDGQADAEQSAADDSDLPF